MGCGKSSVGRRLSELLCWHFIDLDEMIVSREGRTIPEIFETEGEAAFRQMELEALREIAAYGQNNMILSSGGGTVMTPECAEIIRKKSVCIYLKASADTLMAHLEGQEAGRPMLSSKDIRTRIEDMMSQRSATYEKTAHIIIDTDGRSIEDIASEIIENLK